MNGLSLQEIADLFGCYACVNKYEEDRVLLYERYPYYNKDSGVYGGRCIGWVENTQEDLIPRVAVPAIICRASIGKLIRTLQITLVIGPEQISLYNQQGIICGVINTRHLIFAVGVEEKDSSIICHSQYDARA